MKDKNMAVLGIGTAQALGFLIFLLPSLLLLNKLGLSGANLWKVLFHF